MKSKLIATTILGTGLLFNANAYAAGIKVKNPNETTISVIDQGEITTGFINGVQYTTEESFLNALGTISGLSVSGASTITIDPGNGIEKIKGTFADLQALISDPTKAQALGIELDQDDIEELKELEGLILSLNVIQAGNSKEFNDIKQLANSKSTLAQLEAQANPTAETQQQIQQLQTDIAANSTANLTPNSAETQEILKTQAEILAKLSQLDDKLSRADFAKKIDELKALKDTLFVDASKTKTLSELTPVQKPDTITTDTLSASADAITGVVDNRLHGFTAAGVASGDFLQSFGGWVKGLYTKAEQKAHGLTTGYKLDQSGATIGFDAGDDIKIGAAYSFTKSRVTAKGISAKENINSHIGTIYGLATINDQFFTSGQGSYGISNIKKSRNTADTNNNVASAKTKGNVASGKLEFGYDYNLENSALHFVPSVGVAHNSVSVKGYKETGSGLNRKIGKRTTSRTSALLGVMTKYEVNMGSFALLPEIHVNVDYALSSKNADTKITVIDGLDPLVTPSTKLTKMKYTVGTSVKLIQSKAFNAGVGYDLGLAKKFMSHTGSINVRAEF
jgi:outer membrane autotransporter protein